MSDNVESRLFWSLHYTTAYESLENADLDPSLEPYRSPLGISLPFSSILFLETSRDSYYTQLASNLSDGVSLEHYLAQTLTHEMGHQVLLDYNTGNRTPSDEFDEAHSDVRSIMWPSPVSTAEFYFDTASIAFGRRRLDMKSWEVLPNQRDLYLFD